MSLFRFKVFLFFHGCLLDFQRELWRQYGRALEDYFNNHNKGYETSLIIKAFSWSDSFRGVRYWSWVDARLGTKC